MLHSRSFSLSFSFHAFDRLCSQLEPCSLLQRLLVIFQIRSGDAEMQADILSPNFHAS
jgi:hypothetical protein